MWQFTKKLLVICRASVTFGALVLCLGIPTIQAVERGSWPLGWTDADGDCQDTEVEVLVRDAAGLLQWGDPEACTIATGTWRSLAIDLALPLDNILVIPLVMPDVAERDGAKKWDTERKRAFINDPDNLIILDVGAAQKRGDKGPADWQPHRKFHCLYATRWQQVKQRYQLTTDEREDAALAGMLETCAPAVAD